jgi:hypothetical protein
MATKMATLAWRGARPIGAASTVKRGLQGWHPQIAPQRQTARGVHRDPLRQQELPLDPVAALAAGGEAKVRPTIQLSQGFGES